MKLPNAEHALVEQAKILDYLLSSSHPDGRSKADFFRRFGFRRERWNELAEALRLHGRTHEVARAVESEYGTRYSVDGELETPDGRRPRVRTVWIVEAAETETTSGIPRLVTAYPL